MIPIPITYNDVCLNSGDVRETPDEIIVNCVVMRAGVFNGKKKPPDELAKSTRWWQGLPITLESNAEIGDHPNTGITTAKTVRVGQLLNPVWDPSALKINAKAHFIKEMTPRWLQDDLKARKAMGVSGAYFCSFLSENGEIDGKKYDAVEMDYVPNNLAIVKNPACKLPECGLNVNSTNSTIHPKLNITINRSIEDLKSGKVEKEITSIIDASIKQNSTEEIKMTEDMVTKVKFDELAVQLDSEQKTSKEKDQKIALLEADKLKLNEELKVATDKLVAIETDAKKTKFLAQFPEENREKAEKELLPIFMEKPAELVLNHAEKMAELMFVTSDKTEVKSEGAEFVQSVSMNAEERELQELGFDPSRAIKAFADGYAPKSA